MRDELIDKIGVTFEICGSTKMSREAMLVIVKDLEQYSDREVSMALDRCRKELTGRMSLADVIQRMPKSRPSADEAWAMLPRDESASVVWTEEMMAAYAVVREIMDDPTAARMAFRETYNRLCQESEDNGKETRWGYSAGTYVPGREKVLRDAVASGKLDYGYAKSVCPDLDAPVEHRLLPMQQETEDVESIQGYIRQMKEKMGVKF